MLNYEAPKSRIHILRSFIMKHARVSILTGILVGTSYIPFPPWAIFFCFIPLWLIWLEEKSLAQIFLSGWLAQFVFTFIGFNWVAHTLHEFGYLPWPIALIALSFFCAIANLYVPVIGLIWALLVRKLKLNRAGQILALPILMSIAERISPMIFDWHMGYTWLWARLPAFQLADIIGFVGLANIGLAFNAVLLVAYLKWKERLPWVRWAAIVPVTFVLMNVGGYLRERSLPEPDAELRFLLVQANIGNQDKLASEAGWAYRDLVIDRWINLTRKALDLSPADFVVWPETAFPETIENASMFGQYPSKLRMSIKEFDTKLITGGYSIHLGDGRFTNSFFILNKDGTWMAPPYHKTILLMFGEYFPFGDRLPFLFKLFPQVGNYGRGPGPTILNAGGVRIGAQICYEGLFDWFSRSLANKGAQVIVNLTNDSWYGTWEQPYQHGYMTFARAVETRRPLVRSTNTGISTVALASGEILEPSPLHEEWFQHYGVPYYLNPKPTIFMGWGYWLIPSILLLLFLGLFWRGFKQNNN